jgi:hypothetical protein
MVSQRDVYRRAQLLIDNSGTHAAEHAYRMLLRSLQEDDLPQAGDWLAIGQAIENLQSLPPLGRRH